VAERTASSHLDAKGPAAPPRANGELVFEAPWESRLFGLTVALCDGGAFEWDRFRRLLIEEIAAWEAGHPSGEGYRYYECWLAAFERLMEDLRVLSRGEVDALEERIAARPPGHDHGH